MTKERLIQSIKANLLKGSKRTAFMKRVFAEYGEHVSYFPKIMPLYPELIKFGSNIVVASGVNFITHDAIHEVLNNLPMQNREGSEFKERVGCIEIGNNVFIGANSTIMYNTRIGSNVIIGCGTLVLNDLDDNGTYAGTPAKKIGTFEEFVSRRMKSEPATTIKRSQAISIDETMKCWEDFYKIKSERESYPLRNCKLGYG